MNIHALCLLDALTVVDRALTFVLDKYDFSPLYATFFWYMSNSRMLKYHVTLLA